MMKTLEFKQESDIHCVLILPIAHCELTHSLSWLSPEESARADRFRVAHARNAHIAAHGLKRYCLSQYLKTPASALSFTTGDHGKPYCALVDAPYFNLSHCDDCVLLGISSLAEIGVDVESVTRQTSTDISARVLNEQQQKSLQQSSDPTKTFMLYWTQKEAISKTLGLGLSIDFKTVECSGREGLSDTLCHNQQIRLRTQVLNGTHAISLASTNESDFKLYLMNEWSSSCLNVEEIVPTNSLI